MKLVQCELVRQSNIFTVGWLPVAIARVEKIIKDAKAREWRILNVYSSVVIEKEDIPHGWKVGGLG